MPRTFLIWSKMRWRSALSFGSRNTKALSLVRAAAGAGVIAGVLVEGWSAARRGAATAKHSAAAIAVARAIETRPRSELSYIIGLNFLVIPGADAPFRCQ